MDHFHKVKDLILCFTEDRNEYIFIFRWTIPLIFKSKFQNSNEDFISSLIPSMKVFFMAFLKPTPDKLLSEGPSFPHIHYKILLSPLKSFLTLNVVRGLRSGEIVCMDVITPQNHSKRAKKISFSVVQINLIMFCQGNRMEG